MPEKAKKVNIKLPIDHGAVNVEKDPFYAGAYVISLPLDDYPSYVWQTLFEYELWLSLDFWDRKAIVVGNELKLVTTKDLIEKKLSWLDGLVTATNKRLEEYNKSLATTAAHGTVKSADEEAIRNELRSWLLKKESH